MRAVETGDAASAQPAVDRRAARVDRLIVCALAPAVVGAAYRLGLAAPGEGEPDAQAHFRHEAARWFLMWREEGQSPEQWFGFANLFRPAVTDRPPRLREVVLDGVEGERADVRDRVHHFLRFSASSE